MRGEERGKRQLESKEALCVDLALNPSKASDRLAVSNSDVATGGGRVTVRSS